MSARSLARLLLSAAVFVVPACQPPPSPVPRPAPAFNGSARWAWNLSAPAVAAFAADAKLYQLLGSDLFPDGRLPANRGAWSFITWSPSQQKIFQVTVDAAGTLSSSTRDEATPPGVTGNPLPATWANSLEAFQATVPHRAAGASWTNLVALNLASYPTAPGQAVWAMNFNEGSNQLVRWDGIYIGPQ